MQPDSEHERTGRATRFLGKRTPGSWRLRIVTSCIVAFLASCGDSVTDPPSPSLDGSIAGPRAIVANNDDEQVVITRTVDIAAVGGRRAIHKEQSARVPASEVARSVGVGSLSDRTFGAVRVFAPAVSEVGLPRSRVAWIRKQASSKSRTDTIESRGIGDAPASSIRLIRDGRTIISITLRWIRREASWDLERRETVTQNGEVREVVAVKYGDAEVRTARTLAASLAARPLFSDAPAAGIAAFRPKADYSDPCLSDNLNDPPPCAAKKTAVESAWVEYWIAAAVMVTVCEIPGLNILACAAGVAGFSWQTQKTNRAVQEYNKCKADYKVTCGCTGGESLREDDNSLIRAASHWRSLAAPIAGSYREELATRWRPRNSSGTCTDFYPDPDGVDVGGSQGGEMTEPGWICYFRVTWNEYGDVISVVDLGCVQQT